MKYILSSALIFLASHYSLGQVNYNFIDSVKVTAKNSKEDLIKIKDNYYVIAPNAFGGNIGLYVGKNEVILVDDQLSVSSTRIKEMIKTITDKPIKYILNTHYHFDHVDGNKAFGKENISIIAHENLRDRLAKDQVIEAAEYRYGKFLQRAYPFEGLPTITFTDSIKLYIDKEVVDLIHFNAHTDGDAVIHFKNADIYHTGDIFVTYGLPVVDESHGGDIYEMVATVDYLVSVSNSETRFIPGHGPVCSVKELVEYKKLITSSIEQISNLMKEGVPLEKIINEVKIDEKLADFKKEFIEHVYRMTLKHKKLPSKRNSK